MRASVGLLQLGRIANFYIYEHYAFMGFFVVCMFVIYNVTPWAGQKDWGRLILVACGILGVMFLSVEWKMYKLFERYTTEELEGAGSSITAKSLRENLCWVARLGDELIGCVVIQRPTAKSAAILSHWNVRHRYRERGLGADLLDQALKSMPDARVECTTWSFQDRAEKTLAANGWAIVGTTKLDDRLLRFIGVKKHLWSRQSKKD